MNVPEFSLVIKRLKYKNGMLIGNSIDNNILETKVYEVEYPHIHKISLAANAIAENMFYEGGGEGNINVLFKGIIDHQKKGS